MAIYYNGHLQSTKGGGGSSGGGGGIDYSTTEQDTGLKWIDGKPIYQKTFSLAFTSNFLSVDLTALNIDSVVKIEGGVCDSSGGYIPFGYENATSIYTASSTTMSVNNSYNGSRPNGNATIYYTKTTDTV